MNKPWHISRRTVLRGLGTAVALPLLDAMAPAIWALAADDKKAIPNRMAFVYVPNGKNMADWTPRAEGPTSNCRPSSSRWQASRTSCWSSPA